MLCPWNWHGAGYGCQFMGSSYNGAWNQNQDLTVFVSNPNDTLWGLDTWGTYFWGGGQNMDMSLNNSGKQLKCCKRRMGF